MAGRIAQSTSGFGWHGRPASARCASAIPANILAVLVCILFISTHAFADTVVTPPAAAPIDLSPRPLGSPEHAAKSGPSAARAAATPSAASALTDNPVVRTSLSLGVVLGLIFACAAIYRRFGAKLGLCTLAANPRRPNAAPAGILEVLGRYPIARGQTLLLLKLDRRVLLVSQIAPRIRGGSGSLSTLAEITEPEDVASILLKAQDAEGASQAAKFQSLLGRFDDAHASESDHATTLSTRDIRANDSGDRSELYNERAVTSFPLIQPLAESTSSPHAPAAQPSDAFGSLRQRLHALNGEAHR